MLGRPSLSGLALLTAYRKRLCTTIGVERLNEEMRRRKRVIRIFPNQESAIRLLGALLMEQDEQCSTSKRYLDMTTYRQWRGRREVEDDDHARGQPEIGVTSVVQ